MNSLVLWMARLNGSMRIGFAVTNCFEELLASFQGQKEGILILDDVYLWKYSVKLFRGFDARRIRGEAEEFGLVVGFWSSCLVNVRKFWKLWVLNWKPRTKNRAELFILWIHLDEIIGRRRCLEFELLGFLDDRTIAFLRFNFLWSVIFHAFYSFFNYPTFLPYDEDITRIIFEHEYTSSYIYQPFTARHFALTIKQECKVHWSLIKFSYIS